MPPIEHEDLRHYALLWEPDGIGTDGRTKHDAASQELSPLVMQGVRFVWRKSKGTDPNGDVVALDATLIASRVIPLQSLVWHGSQEDLEADLTGTGTGNTLQPEADIYEVVTASHTPDQRLAVTRYEYGLRRYADQMTAAETT